MASSLYKKLAAVTAAVGYVPKNGRNDFHKYDYVTEADLVGAIRDKLAQQGVAYLFSVIEETVRPVLDKDGSPAKAGPVTTVKVVAEFCDGETGETATVSAMGSGQDAGDKGLYKAITGAQKYLLMKTFLVPTGDDPEGDTKVDQAAADTRPAAKAHGKKAGVKVSDDPQELVVPSGKFKDRKIGSLNLAEARTMLVPGIPAESDFGKAVRARIATLEAMEKVPELQAVNEVLDLEAAK